MEKDFRSAIDGLKEALPQVMNAFEGLRGAVVGEGALGSKTKELIMVGISIAIRCERCVRVHVEAARELGASRDEVLEAAGCAILMAGGPAVGFSATSVLEALDGVKEGLEQK